MSDERDQVRETVLELGLEDWIPLPQLVDWPEDRPAMTASSASVLREVLLDLLDEGAIAIYRGPWDQEPDRVDDAEARELQKDDRWYSYDVDDPDEERLFFVNVDNVVEPEQS